MLPLIKILRIRQWTKNIFVLAPLIFSKFFLEPTHILESFLAFILFSLASSGIYIFNDIKDVEYDKSHPFKKNRPLASGEMSIAMAYLISFTLLFLVTFFSWIFLNDFLKIILFYILISILYTLYFKYIPIIDILVIALGFVIRVIGGIFAIGAPFSFWIASVTFFLALFLIISKRMNELKIVGLSTKRSVLSFYKSDFLRSFMIFSMIMVATIYALYTILEVDNKFFFISVFPVIYGLTRFFKKTIDSDIKNDDPTELILNDKVLQLNIAVFVILCLVLL